MRLVNRLSVLALVSALPLAACGGDDGGITPVQCDPASYQDYTFVVDSVQLPTTPAEALQLGLDLDGDDRADNTLGMVIATLADQANLDVTTAVTEAINGGDVILLASLQTDNIAASACARVGVFLGENPSIAPCVDVNDTVCGAHLQGDASFDIALGSPTDTKIDGQIVGGQFELGDNPPGNFTIEIDIAELGQPLALNLIGARVQVDTTEGELTGGLIGGAITEADLNNSLLPAIAGVIADVVQADCAGGVAPDCCTPGSAGEQVISLFDADDSCDVSLQELIENDLIAALLAPDVDLLNANGEFSPNEDGIADSLSIGLGFSATTGAFTIPQ